MKILFFTSEGEDYLQDQLLIGFRRLLGSSLIDYPRKDVLYKNAVQNKKDLYGNGFTIWKTLDDIAINRTNVFDRLQSGEFDIVMFSSIWRQQKFFKTVLAQKTKLPKLVFIDGEDFTRLYLRALPYGSYFKREQRFYHRLLVKKINFSIPSDKILQDDKRKTKLFALHNQCEEAYKLEEIKNYCQRKYAFTEEADYYNDLAVSKYAITMKKGGWDCMRHYEIAANLSIPCFYKLDKKPTNCAPHGLVDMENVVSFNSAEELKRKIQKIDNENLYAKIQKGVGEWVSSNECEHIASSLLERF